MKEKNSNNNFAFSLIDTSPDYYEFLKMRLNSRYFPRIINRIDRALTEKEKINLTEILVRRVEKFLGSNPDQKNFLEVNNSLVKKYRDSGWDYSALLPDEAIILETCDYIKDQFSFEDEDIKDTLKRLNFTFGGSPQKYNLEHYESVFLENEKYKSLNGKNNFKESAYLVANQIGYEKEKEKLQFYQRFHSHKSNNNLNTLEDFISYKNNLK